MWGDELKQYLNRERVKYVTIRHSPVYTAQEIAASAHVPGRELAKSVVVKLDGKLALVVLPASEHVDFALLADATGAREATLAEEQEFADRFAGCERGAMPPFGNLYGLDVYVAESLAEDEEIAFNAGSFTELIKMPYRDFARLAQPVVLRLTAGAPY